MVDAIKCIEILAGMGYNKSDIEDSLKQQKYDGMYLS